MLDIKKLLKKSSLSKKVGTSATITSVCFRIIKQRYHIAECDGYIKHNILFLQGLPREASILLYRDKPALLGEITQELLKFDIKYTLKNIIMK